MNIFRNKFSKHLDKVHSKLCIWDCAKCKSKFNTYNKLYIHNHELHETGQFACSFPDCQFQSDIRRKVWNHVKVCSIIKAILTDTFEATQRRSHSRVPNVKKSLVSWVVCKDMFAYTIRINVTIVNGLTVRRPVVVNASSFLKTSELNK